MSAHKGHAQNLKGIDLKYLNKAHADDSLDSEIENLLSHSDSEKVEFEKEFDSVKSEVNLNNDLDKALETVNDDSISFLNLSSTFKNHDLVANKINEMPEIGWTASS
mmetsp:Transcript_66459/g.143370  ORF Transcript_66459/g.143370 Transcript_66459/m.143370 type:complete len:107 (+) Transcript_66459:778-1098(+)